MGAALILGNAVGLALVALTVGDAIGHASAGHANPGVSRPDLLPAGYADDEAQPTAPDRAAVHTGRYGGRLPLSPP